MIIAIECGPTGQKGMEWLHHRVWTCGRGSDWRHTRPKIRAVSHTFLSFKIHDHSATKNVTL